MLGFLLLSLSSASIYSPEQVHIAWSDSDSSMSVTFAAQYPSQGASVQYTPVPSYNTSVRSYAFSVLCSWTSFPNMAAPRILQRHLNVCKALLTNLTAGALYAYRVGSEAYGWSPSYVFRAKRSFDDPNPTRMLVYGDLGVGDQIVETMLRLTQETFSHDYDGVIHNGDFAYDLDDEQGYRGDVFMRSIEPVASRLPYMVSQGNHESDLVLPHYLNRFQMPGNVSNLWHSFNLGKAHYVAYNTEPLFDGLDQEQAQQMQWLAEDLKSVNRTMFPWLIVFGHRPLYCSPNVSTTATLRDVPRDRDNKDCQKHAVKVRGAFEELFYNNSVDLVIEGHVHAYERLSSVYNNQSVNCDYQDQNWCVGAKAPVYIVTGVPGQNDSYSPVSPTPLPFSMFQDDHLGYSRLTVFNASHLLFEQVLSETAVVIDYLWLVKNNSVAYNSRS
jgi:acid phosphatase type 7